VEVEKSYDFFTALGQFDNESADRAITCDKDKRLEVVQGLPKMMKFMSKQGSSAPCPLRSPTTVSLPSR